MYYKTIKKSLKNFFYSKVFFIFILTSVVGYTSFVIFTYFRYQSDSNVFSSFFNYLQRYDGIRKSNSFVPGQELLDDIIKTKCKTFLFSSFKEQYTLLEICVLINQCQYEKAMSLLDTVLTSSNMNNIDDLHYLYYILKAILLSSDKNCNKKQEGIDLLKTLSEKHKLCEIGLFYYGFFLRRHGSLKQADEVFLRFKNDPQFKASPYVELIEQVRNIEI